MSAFIRSILVLIGLLAIVTLGVAVYRAYHLGDSDSIPSTEPALPTMTPLSATIPAKIPEFSLLDSNNQDRSITEWAGKSLVINFWATWCPPCLREIPLLKSLQEQRAAEGVQVVGIAVDRREPVLTFMQEAGIEYPVLIGEQAALEVAEALGVVTVALPFTVFADQQGRILTLQMGELSAEQASRILDLLRAVNRGALSLTEAQRRIDADQAEG